VADRKQTVEEPKESLSFEQIVEQLSAVVVQLEDGALPLEQALATFERGVALSRLGSKRLDEAERRIEVLIHEGQGLETRPYSESSDER
jgi:exodeoxyribonuclease VII small subunit